MKISLFSYMRHTLLAFTLFIIFVLPALVLAEDLPFGVSPKEITVSGTIDIVDGGSFGLSKGKLLDSYEWKEGNRVGVRLSSIGYSLHFWNVGKMGGTSGYLFWKKDFERATLYMEYNSESNGQVVTGKVDNSKIGLPDGWKLEEAESEPDINAASCSLKFSGGPKGTFKGTCSNGGTIEGRIAGTGTYVIFEKITQPDEPESAEVALSIIANKELMLSGEFGDWKFDESTLEDSGARFSSMSGEVETKHENDTEWNFAKLDTVLYVLDHVKTGEESQAIIGFRDLSTFLLKEDSEIVVTTPPKKDSKIGLVYGTIKANVKKMWNEGTMEVETSQAVSGIKGTRFILTDTGTESKLEVTEGTVAYRSKATGEEVMVSAGEAVVATASGLEEKTTFDAATADAELIRETEAAEVPAATVATTEVADVAEESTQSQSSTNYSIVTGIVILIAALGGVWVLRRRKVVGEVEG